jgi:hypothetical protein
VKVRNKEVGCITDGKNIYRLFKMSCNRMLKYRIIIISWCFSEGIEENRFITCKVPSSTNVSLFLGVSFLLLMFSPGLDCRASSKSHC